MLIIKLQKLTLFPSISLPWCLIIADNCSFWHWCRIFLSIEIIAFDACCGRVFLLPVGSGGCSFFGETCIFTAKFIKSSFCVITPRPYLPRL